MNTSWARYAIWAAAALGAGTLRGVEITLPRETAALTPSALPGYALASAYCGACHSADYVQYQPPASTGAYWQATVVKMQKTFAAPIPDTAIDPIVEYLIKVYGARGVVPATTPTAPTTAPAKKV